MTPIRAALLICLVVAGACGHPGVAPTNADPTPEAGVPTRLDVVCYRDGSTELLNDEVVALSDGVHVRVDNRAGEFVSLNGTGHDFSEGVEEQVVSAAPGELEVACWPGSRHEGPEPELLPLLVRDLKNYWVTGELECPRDGLVEMAIFDFGTVATSGNPEEIARTQLSGVAAGDTILTVGYPEAPYREIAVERESEIIMVVSYSPAPKRGWILSGYHTCASSGLGVQTD